MNRRTFLTRIEASGPATVERRQIEPDALQRPDILSLCRAAEGGRHPPYIYWDPPHRASPRLTLPLFDGLVDAGLVARTTPGSDHFHLTASAYALLTARGSHQS